MMPPLFQPAAHTEDGQTGQAVAEAGTQPRAGGARALRAQQLLHLCLKRLDVCTLTSASACGEDAAQSVRTKGRHEADRAHRKRNHGRNLRTAGSTTVPRQETHPTTRAEKKNQKNTNLSLKNGRQMQNGAITAKRDNEINNINQVILFN
jgi:hypothetical protein